MLRTARPFADPGTAAPRLLEHAHAFEPNSDGWIHIEQIHHPFLFGDKALPAVFSAGFRYAVRKVCCKLPRAGCLHDRHKLEVPQVADGVSGARSGSAGRPT